MYETSFFGGASMGPRLVSRGKYASAVIGDLSIRLQWGRDLLVAESVLVTPLAPASPRFNGAATC